jgi:hypothetical protein
MSQKVLVSSLETPLERIFEEYLSLSGLINEFQHLKSRQHLVVGKSISVRDLEKKIVCFQKHLLKLSYQGVQLEHHLNTKPFNCN